MRREQYIPRMPVTNVPTESAMIVDVFIVRASGRSGVDRGELGHKWLHSFSKR
jgi:hypothetical protein